MKRREFITLLSSAAGAVAWPLAARTEPFELPIVGFLHAGNERPRAVASFQKGLAEGGYVADRNVAFDFRWADGQFDRLPGLAADLAGRNVAVIAALGNTAARAAKAATTTIPIAFASSSDPVAVGLVSSLNRPGWNLTGVSILNQELESTRLERLAQVVPHASTIAFVVNPDSVTTGPKLREMANAARLLGRRLQVFNARNESEFEQALLSVVAQRLGAMMVTADTMFSNESAALGRAAARHAVPAIGAYRDFARAGGLMCYGSDLGDAYRRVGLCTARILKGEAPRDLPVTQSTKVEFVINAGAARALGLIIPPTLIALADEVIE